MRSSDQKKNPPSEPDLGNLPHSTLIADPLRWIKRTVEPGERASEDYRNLVLREKWKCVVIRELHKVCTLFFFFASAPRTSTVHFLPCLGRDFTTCTSSSFPPATLVDCNYTLPSSLCNLCVLSQLLFTYSEYILFFSLVYFLVLYSPLCS